MSVGKDDAVAINFFDPKAAANLRLEGDKVIGHLPRIAVAAAQFCQIAVADASADHADKTFRIFDANHIFDRFG
ncbi:hypothetical protein [Pseudooceanicola nitratireducens]|uniref:hypothetical protein n=1 Tax=Pseudooceanicola nitratireducens TaxID=517719 RepID=UPI0011143F04|nr:hypothetical protein [Pseudooceanicola nitratireducens]